MRMEPTGIGSTRLRHINSAKLANTFRSYNVNSKNEANNIIYFLLVIHWDTEMKLFQDRLSQLIR
jgi:hypothetical protein